MRDAENAVQFQPGMPAQSVPTSKPQAAFSAYGFQNGLEQLPASFRGTTPDGALRVDEKGNLLIENEVRLLFDYFLSGYGEEASEKLEARIRAYIQAHLNEPAISQANQLLDDYLALRLGLTALEQDNDTRDLDTESMEKRLQAIRDMRRTYLTAEAADAFFAEEEAYDRFTLNKIKILQQTQLSPEQKAYHLAEIAQQLPESVQHALQSSQQLIDLQHHTQRILQAGGTEETLHQMRSMQVGSVAAQRLAELDQRRDHWRQRFDRWLLERGSVQLNPGLSETDKNALLVQLRRERFDESELRRVEALERIQDTPELVSERQ